MARYLLLLTGPDHFARWDAMTPDELDGAYAAFRSFAQAVAERGEIVDGDALHHPKEARTVSRDSRTVTEGPFAESVEQISGYYLIDVPDLDTATDLAKLLPHQVTVEVRPTKGVQVR